MYVKIRIQLNYNVLYTPRILIMKFLGILGYKNLNTRWIYLVIKIFSYIADDMLLALNLVIIDRYSII